MSENKTSIDDVEDAGSHMAGTETVARAEKASPFSARVVSTLKSLRTIEGFKAAAKRVGYRIFRLTGETTAVILGLGFAWLCAVNILIAQRVMDVSFMEDDAARWFTSAFDGKNASVGKMTLAWEAADNTVIFRAQDIAVTDKDGGVLNTIAGVETELSLRDVAKAKLDPMRVVVDGGELSFLRDVEGNFIAGLGTPETVGAFGPIWRGQRNDGDNDLEIGRLRSLDIRNAKIYVQDAGMEYKAELNETEFDVAFGPDNIAFDMRTRLTVPSGDNASSSAPMTLKGRVSPDLENVDVSLSGAEFNPSELLPRKGRIAGLRVVDAPLKFDLRTLAKRGTGLEVLDITLNAGAGSLSRAGKREPFNTAEAAARYDPQTERLDIGTLSINSAPLSLSGTAALSNIGTPAAGLFSKNTGFEAELSSLDWKAMSLAIDPVSTKDVTIRGEILRDDNQIRFDKLMSDFGSFQPDLSALITRGENGKLSAVSIKGRIDGTVNKEQLLAIWPRERIVGARRWIDRSIIAATLSNLDVRFDANEDVLAGVPLKDPDLTLTFDLADGQVRYISTMTPVTNVAGRGTLLGNQVEFSVSSGTIDEVVLETGKVTIPRIYPYGGDLIIEGKGQGPVTTLVGLLDQKPFEYVSPYGVSPSDFTGRGDVKVKITRPLREKITYEQVDFEVSGNLTDVSAPFSVGDNKLQNGAVAVYADTKGLSVKGPVNIGPWEADLAWQEVFDNGATPTRYSVNGRLSQSDLDSFGIGMREFIGGGDVVLSIDAQADGVEITRADVTANLKETNMRIGPYWDKPIGTDAQMTAVMSFTKDKQLRMRDMVLTSPGLDLEGTLDIGSDYRLENLDLSQAKIAGFIDAAVQLKPSPDRDRFDVFVTGDYLDVSPFVSGTMDGGGSVIDVPVLLTAALSRLALDEAYVLRDANVLFAHNGEGVTQARLKGVTSDGPLSVDLSTNEEQSLRDLEIDVPNASDALYALFGLDSLTGGRLQLSADLPPVGNAGALTGTARVEDVKLVNAPIMTTLLSLASLQGLVDALGGEGLKFEKLEIPFSYNQGRLSVREGRASGPGLGMTGNGEIAFDTKALDLDGVLVPAYTANSMLGSIPVIGDIFVGKKGEGIFALNYTVQGPFDKAQVAVNPLSALTPGFLRGIFATQRDELPEQLRESIESVRPVAPIAPEPEP